MSRAWYKPGVAPVLLRSYTRRNNAAVEVWNTTCAVTNFGKTTDASCSVLINPANPQLSGVSKFSYFPRGGPAPKVLPSKDSHPIMGYVSQWGGMEVGDGMLFSANVVDGMVHQLGGWRLAWELESLPLHKGEDEEKCPVGHAVATGPGGNDLKTHFDHIIHTVPPFYKHHPDPEKWLLKCYENSLALAFTKGSRVACPLLGAGGRGFPLEVAIRLAGQASVNWRNDQHNNNSESCSLAFAIPDQEIAEALLEAIESSESESEHVESG